MARVIKAYTTNHRPDGGNLTEEILVLETGQAVFLTPDDVDTICADEDTAWACAYGTPEESEESPALLAAWAKGYKIPKDADVFEKRPKKT